MCRDVVGAMDSSSNAGAAGWSVASGTPSLKKLKREAAQRRKAHARSLKLRSEEQERLQRLEIDALVEQQRLQRLERQQDTERLVRETSNLTLDHSKNPSPNDDTKCITNKLKHNTITQINATQQSQAHQDDSKKLSTSSNHEAWPTPKDTQTSTKAGTKQVSNSNSSTSTSTVTPSAAQLQQQKQEQMRVIIENRRKLARGPRSGNMLLDIGNTSSFNSSSSVLPSEDHRVVSTEYQAAGTQALMRVTLLAAGFVIGARGISARLIGQITGAIIQSWTEPQACRSSCSVPIRLFRIQGKKSVVQAAVSLVEQAVAKYKELCECKRRGEFVQREHVINGVEFYYQPPPRKAFVAPESPKSGLKEEPPPPPPPVTATVSVADVPLASSLAFPTHHVWLRHLQQKQAAAAAASAQEKSVKSCSQSSNSAEPYTAEVDGTVERSAWSNINTSVPEQSHHVFQVESSLFSVFGNGGLPLPIAQDCEAPPFVKSAVSSTPFDFPTYDFFRDFLPQQPVQQPRDGYNPFASHQLHTQAPPQQQKNELCVVCVERPPATHLVACGHVSLCSSCVQGVGKCPVCQEKVVGWQALKGSTQSAI